MCDTTLTLPRPNIYTYLFITYPLPRRPSTGRGYVLPSLRTRCQFTCSITTAHLSDTQTHCSSITHYSTTLDLRHWTRLASLRGNDWSSALASSRGRNHKTNHGSRTSSNTRWNLHRFKSDLPVSVRQVNLPDRSVRQAAFLPQVVRFYYVIYGNTPALRRTNSLERVSGLRQNCNPWRRSAARRKRGCLEAWQCTG